MREVTDEYLAEVEARCAAATEGPWEIDYNETVGHIKSLADPDRHTPTVARYNIWFDGRVSDHFAESMGYTKDGERANGVFIANARLDVPTLVAEVRRLRGEIDASLNLLGEHRIRVREGGGPEDVVKSLAVSLGAMEEKHRRLNLACDIFEKNSANAAELDSENYKLKHENERLRAEVARLATKLETK